VLATVANYTLTVICGSAENFDLSRLALTKKGRDITFAVRDYDVKSQPIPESQASAIGRVCPVVDSPSAVGVNCCFDVESIDYSFLLFIKGFGAGTALRAGSSRARKREDRYG